MNDLTTLATKIQVAISELPETESNGYRIRFVAPLTANFSANGEYPMIVTDYYCAICAADGRDDGEGPCIHKQTLRRAWDMATRKAASERRFRDALAADDRADNAEIGHVVPDIDDRREAHYQAGHYPPAPVYY